MSRWYWLLLFIGVFLSAGGGILLKLGATEITYGSSIAAIGWQLIRNWKILLGIFCYAVPVLIWIFMLKKIDLCVLQPLFSLIYVVTPLLAIFVLHEQVSSMQWLGIAVIICGVTVFAHG